MPYPTQAGEYVRGLCLQGSGCRKGAVINQCKPALISCFQSHPLTVELAILVERQLLLIFQSVPSFVAVCLFGHSFGFQMAPKEVRTCPGQSAVGGWLRHRVAKIGWAVSLLVSSTSPFGVIFLWLIGMVRNGLDSLKWVAGFTQRIAC